MKTSKIKMLSAIITCCLMICVMLGGVFLTKGFKSLIEAAIEGGIGGSGTSQEEFEGGGGGSSSGSSLSAFGWYGSGTQTDPYQISSKADLQLLETYVNDTSRTPPSGVDASEYITTVSANTSSVCYHLFKDKYFVLKKDINCDSSSISIGYYNQLSNLDGTFLNYTQMFAGNIDGQNYKIESLKWSGTPDVNFGLFLYSVGTIKNIQFMNLTFIAEEDLIKTHYIAPIVCYNSGTIDNCIVENVTIETYQFRSQCNFGVVSSANSGTISNCLVTGSLTIKAPKKNIWPLNPDGAIIKTFIGSGVGTVTKCVFSATITKESDGGDTSYITEDFSNLPSDCYVETNSTYSALGENLSDGGADLGDKKWYFSKVYSAWPMLRSYMTWESISFSSADTKQGTVSPSSILIPSDAFANFSTYAENVKTNTSYLTIYNQQIKAYAAFGYQFQKWVGSISPTAISYTAYFTDAYYCYTFESLVIDGKTIDPVIYLSDQVVYDTEIKVGVGTDTMAECEYTSTKTVIIYLVGDYTVTYTVDAKYTLDQCGTYSFYIYPDDPEDTAVSIEDMNEYHSIYHLGAYGSTIKFTAPTVKLKTYNTKFE